MARYRECDQQDDAFSVTYIDWSKEPDLEHLREAHSLLASNPEQALLELKGLADRGSVMSMVYIADSYKRGKTAKVDLAQAEDWYRRAMNAGSILGSYELGRLYYEMKNYPKAEEAFRVGERKDYPPSLHALGLMHLKGFGLEKDLSKARDLFERASALGHVYAMRNLGALLVKGGYGVSQFFRGLGLLLRASKDAVVIVWKDEYDDRLR